MQMKKVPNLLFASKRDNMKHLNKYTLLIVEDHAETQQQLRQLLADHVKEIFQAYDGQEALNIFRKHSPDIVLTDIRMPYMDGLSMAKEIKVINPHQPILVLTGYSEQETLLKAANIPVDGYITKPITDIDQLLNGLNRLALNLQKVEKSAHEKIKNIEEEYRRQLQTLYQHSHYDHLTRMPNRLLFRKRLEEAMEGARQAHSEIALFYIDLDNLKQVNDQHGHQVGDHAIKMIINNIHDVIDSKDLFARIGGDEFALIVETVDHYDNLMALAEKVLLAAALPVYYNGVPLKLSCSIGVSRYPRDAVEMKELIHIADNAMYQAKANGKNSYCIWGD
jgi:diguanylate cyclase (GGDEF)-like protein